MAVSLLPSIYWRIAELFWTGRDQCHGAPVHRLLGGVRRPPGSSHTGIARGERRVQIRINVTLDVWNAYYSLDSANQQLATTGTLVTTGPEQPGCGRGALSGGRRHHLRPSDRPNGRGDCPATAITAELNWEVARAQLALALGRLSGAEPLSTESTLP